jgi:hypothetical protein
MLDLVAEPILEIGRWNTMLRQAVVPGILAVLLCAVPGWADEFDGNVFVGYSYMRGDFGEQHGDLAAGAIASAAANFHPHVGVVAEWSTHHDSEPGVNFDSHLLLFGPRFYFVRGKRATPFFHVLFGMHQTKIGFPGLGISGHSDNGAALAAGAGLDIRAHRRVAIRIFQVDYVTMDLNYPTTTGSVSEFTDNIRLSAGLVFTWGRR